MLSIDAFYTPAYLATKMVRLIEQEPGVVADFACGDGGLLRAAAKRWGTAHIFGSDISGSAVTEVGELRVATQVSRCNFLSSRSRAQCKALRDIKDKVDVVLLNPPFTCRGGTRHDIGMDGTHLTCSTAMAFLLTASAYLSPSGEVVAILPAGSFNSEKDRAAWDALRDHFNIRVVSEHDNRTFDSCDSNTQIIHLKRKMKGGRTPSTIRSKTPKPNARGVGKTEVTLYRGKVQMHAIPRGRTALAHSTDLRDHKLILNGHKTSSSSLSIKGAFIALPRVATQSKRRSPSTRHQQKSRFRIAFWP
jgi:predicted RNA methylase